MKRAFRYMSKMAIVKIIKKRDRDLFKPEDPFHC